MDIINFRHTGIVTKNLKQSLFFYQRLLKLKVIKTTNENKKLMTKILKVKNCNLKTVKLGLKNIIFLELLYFKNSTKKKTNIKINTPGLTHISLSVKNIENIYKVLKLNKVVFLSKPQFSKDKKVKLVFCKSPENIFIELVQQL